MKNSRNQDFPTWGFLPELSLPGRPSSQLCRTCKQPISTRPATRHKMHIGGGAFSYSVIHNSCMKTLLTQYKRRYRDTRDGYELCDQIFNPAVWKYARHASEHDHIWGWFSTDFDFPSKSSEDGSIFWVCIRRASGGPNTVPEGTYQRFPYFNVDRPAFKAGLGCMACGTDTHVTTGWTYWTLAMKCSDSGRNHFHVHAGHVNDECLRSRLRRAGRLSGIDAQDQLSERALNPVLWSQIKIAASMDELEFGTAVKTLELHDDREYFSLCVGCEQSAAGLPVQDASLDVLDRRLARLEYRAYQHVSCAPKEEQEDSTNVGDGTESDEGSSD